MTGDAKSLRVLGLILLVALGLRLGWVATRGSDAASFESLPDQREYLELAENLLHGRGYQLLDRRFAETVYAFRTPGYPCFVALCGARPRLVRVVQAFIDAGTVAAVFVLARRLVARRKIVAGTPSPTLPRSTGGGRESVALFAASLVALNPFLIYFTGLVLSETLFTAMLAWGMVLLAVGRPGRGSVVEVVTWLGGCFLLALGILVRPSGAALPVLLGLASAFLNRHPAPSYQNRRQIPVGLTTLAVILVVLLPWAYRNWRVTGHWVWLDTNGGITLYDGYHPDATGGSDQSFVSRMPQLRMMNEVERSQYLADRAREYAQAHPARVLKLSLLKLLRTWSPVPLSSEFASRRNVLVGLGYTLPFYALVAIGLMVGPLPRPAKVFLLIPAIYITAVHALTVGSLRYRMPVEPPMAVMAASVAALLPAHDPPWRRARGMASG